MTGEGRIQNVPVPYLTIEEQAAGSVGNPAAGEQRVYVDSTTHAPMIKNSAGASSEMGGGGGLDNSNISPTTTNVTAAINTRYFADISGLTANRNFVVPAGAVGDIIELNIKTGDDTYALIVIGDTGISINGGSAATEWSRLFISGETIQLIADTTSNWQIVRDGRIPCKASMARAATQAITNTTFTKVLHDTSHVNVGSILDIANSKIVVRRAGNYRLMSQAYFESGPATRWLNSIYKNGAGLVTSETNAYAGDTYAVPTTNHLLPFAAADYIEHFVYHNYGSNRNVGISANSATLMTVEEVL